MKEKGNDTVEQVSVLNGKMPFIIKKNKNTKKNVKIQQPFADQEVILSLLYSYVSCRYIIHTYI